MTIQEYPSNDRRTNSTDSKLESLGGHLTFSNGTARIISRLEELREQVPQPVLVGVFGHPNSGKSYLMQTVAEFFKGRGITVAGAGGAPCPSIFEGIRDNPEWNSAIMMFHYGDILYPHLAALPMGTHEDNPVRLARDILGRPLDVKVILYNPILDGRIPVTEDYDFVIRNEQSRRK